MGAFAGTWTGTASSHVPRPRLPSSLVLGACYTPGGDRTLACTAACGVPILSTAVLSMTEDARCYIVFLWQRRGNARIGFPGGVLPSYYIRPACPPFMPRSFRLQACYTTRGGRTPDCLCRRRCGFLITRTAVFFSATATATTDLKLSVLYLAPRFPPPHLCDALKPKHLPPVPQATVVRYTPQLVNLDVQSYILDHCPRVTSGVHSHACPDYGGHRGAYDDGLVDYRLPRTQRPRHCDLLAPPNRLTPSPSPLTLRSSAGDTYATYCSCATLTNVE
ncbi:hypothetical protein R3P38DRAFT_3207700 [Favolaschia claudopus]|uniref:Uncharacterized protein n=1 Tax=Favolaschia claudopus TaxID=2862362 RepID=A0AAW0AJM4_9AGAR